MNNINILLTDAPINIPLKIMEIESDTEVTRKLNLIGIHKNDDLMKLNNTRFGPVLLCNTTNKEAKIALGRSVAKKIKVNSNA